MCSMSLLTINDAKFQGRPRFKAGDNSSEYHCRAAVREHHSRIFRTTEGKGGFLGHESKAIDLPRDATTAISITSFEKVKMS